jgi:hypothetical protein
MASKTPTRPTRQRRAPKSRGRKSARRATKSNARRATNGTPRKTTTNGRSRSLSLPKPPPPEEVIIAVREELERLGNRWKNLLPRLKKTIGGNGSNGRHR